MDDRKDLPLELMGPEELRAQIAKAERVIGRCRAELAKLEGEDPPEQVQSLFADWIARGDPIDRIRPLIEELERREMIPRGCAFFLKTDTPTLLVRDLRVARRYARYDRVYPNELGGIVDFAANGRSEFNASVDFRTEEARELVNVFRAGRLRTIADEQLPDVPFCVLIETIEFEPESNGINRMHLRLSGHVTLYPEDIARAERHRTARHRTARNARLYVRSEATFGEHGNYVNIPIHPLETMRNILGAVDEQVELEQRLATAMIHISSRPLRCRHNLTIQPDLESARWVCTEGCRYERRGDHLHLIATPEGP